MHILGSSQNLLIIVMTKQMQSYTAGCQLSLRTSLQGQTAIKMHLILLQILQGNVMINRHVS